MERRLYATVPENHGGKKIKEFLRAKWNLSASLLMELKQWEDGISVNGTRVNVNHILCVGDEVCISVGDHGADSGFEERSMPLQILYEDSDLIILNKPPFLAVHPSKGHVTDTLANGLTYYYHQKGDTFVSRCVLRLDRNTSGAVLFAKNAYAHDQLRRQLMQGGIQKEYLALVHGTAPFSGSINAPVYRPEQATLRRSVDERGKPALTEYTTEKRDGALSLLRVYPKTGRTHQIRLHLSHVGMPIVSDFLYGREDDGILQRHGLHCARLSFRHPVTGKHLSVKADLATDMKSVSDQLFRVERYCSLDFHLRSTMGEKLVKLPLNGGFSCPNRCNGARGCSFCSSSGSGEFVPKPEKTIKEQLEEGKAILSRKWKNHRYIAYFQAYTNTYAPVERLRSLFYDAIRDPQVAVLSIATRPDCLPEEVLDLLSELNRKKTVWVELGLQTAHDSTAHAVNRGYDLPVYETAVAQLNARGLTVITHLIFGLPSETREQMLSSVTFAAAHSHGLKIQMLQVLEGSSLGDAYKINPFPLLTEEEYVSLICDAIACLPEETVLHRLTGDPPAELLIAPRWTTDKKGVLTHIRKELERRGIQQGCDRSGK